MHDECDVLDPVALHHVGEVVLVPLDLACFILLGFVAEFRCVAGEAGEGGRPEGDAHLVGDEADHVETCRCGPLVGGVDSEPAETETKCDDGPEDQDPRSPGAVVGEATQDEEEDDLDGEGDAVGEEDDTVDVPACAQEV